MANCYYAARVFDSTKLSTLLSALEFGEPHNPRGLTYSIFLDAEMWAFPSSTSTPTAEIKIAVDGEWKDAGEIGLLIT